MANSPVIGNGPVRFTTNDGTHVTIPLTALRFDDKGLLSADAWTLYSIYKSSVDPWIASLRTSQLFVAGPAAAPKPAMVITAANAGAAGNNIQVTFDNVTPDPADPTNPAKTTFNVTIVETDSYPLLSIDAASPVFVKTVLGTEKVAGTQPGLVEIPDGETPKLPKAGIDKLGGGSPTVKSNYVVNEASGAGNAFTVRARQNGVDGDKTVVTIGNIDPVAKTFSLVAKWSDTITGLKLADLPAKLSGYEITVAAPASGTFGVPAPGTVVLSGGASQKPQANASATVVAR